MFLGASLDPDYFNSKVNLFVALGPVTTLNSITNKKMRALSNDWKELEWAAYEAGIFSPFNANWMEIEGAKIVCDLFGIGIMCDSPAHNKVDNMERIDVFLKDFPAGSGYQNIVYYA